jgi:hypothetical protein
VRVLVPAIEYSVSFVLIESGVVYFVLPPGQLTPSPLVAGDPVVL